MTLRRALAGASAALLLAACGDSGHLPAAGDGAPEMPSAEELIENAEASVARKAAAAREECLGLVADGAYAGAVPKCSLAHGLNPNDGDVAAALRQAKDEVEAKAKQAAAAAAAAAEEAATP